MSTEYHLYALEWGPQRIDWFVDDELVHSFEFASDVIYEPEGLHPFRQPFRLKLSLSVGGLVEAPTPEDYPRQMRVRSLRVTRFE
jgi:beta-glucanase (GH16 family)